jgi:hypothetical protein
MKRGAAGIRMIGDDNGGGGDKSDDDDDDDAMSEDLAMRDCSQESGPTY